MSTHHRPDSTASASTLDVVVEAGTLSTLLDGAAALVDECLLAFDDGLVLRARDPADVAQAELRLDVGAFESYTADGQRFGIALDRFRDAVSMADGDQSVSIVLTENRRFRVTVGAFEYTLAPIDPDAVRRVDPFEADSTSAEAVLAGDALEQAVDATDLVSDHTSFDVDPDENRMLVAASGDTDDVQVDFGEDRLDEFSPGRVESLYSVTYLEKILDAVPAGATVTLGFLGVADHGECPLSVAYSFADGAGSGRWFLAPRVKR